ncbi:MAG: acyl-CoA/acyl-ACP dehydrogenase [Planctomycetaceae bacterium]|nr:acyl-CoA/acyl-ACP dehydrogenase [Planctomycetaceae bacterium]
MNDLATDNLFDTDFHSHLTRLRELSASLEVRGGWPEESWQTMCDSGITAWFIPEHFGGNPQPAQVTSIAYIELAAACLTTTFILTQRNAAVSRILSSDNESLKSELAHKLAHNDIFATVGISHLTTSRQHTKDPVLKAIPNESGWLLQGEIPWTTGVEAADIIVTGGIQPDGQQVLIALPTNLPGINIQPAPRLLALNESCTTSVTLDDVRVTSDMLLVGPCENVLAAGSTGGVTTSALALGAAQNSIRGIQTEAEKRPDLTPTAMELSSDLESLKSTLRQMISAPEHPTNGEERETLRKKSNSLVLRAAQAWLTASKGAGFLETHPASRAVREAQFFLVWSCPQNVMAAALAEFSCVSITR